jgi:hypothetical protein
MGSEDGSGFLLPRETRETLLVLRPESTETPETRRRRRSRPFEPSTVGASGGAWTLNPSKPLGLPGTRTLRDRFQSLRGALSVPVLARWGASRRERPPVRGHDGSAHLTRLRRLEGRSAAGCGQSCEPLKIGEGGLTPGSWPKSLDFLRVRPPYPLRRSTHLGRRRRRAVGACFPHCYEFTEFGGLSGRDFEPLPGACGGGESEGSLDLS